MVSTEMIPDQYVANKSPMPEDPVGSASTGNIEVLQRGGWDVMIDGW